MNRGNSFIYFLCAPGGTQSVRHPNHSQTFVLKFLAMWLGLYLFELLQLLHQASRRFNWFHYRESFDVWALLASETAVTARANRINSWTACEFQYLVFVLVGDWHIIGHGDWAAAWLKGLLIHFDGSDVSEIGCFLLASKILFLWNLWFLWVRNLFAIVQLLVIKKVSRDFDLICLLLRDYQLRWIICFPLRLRKVAIRHNNRIQIRLFSSLR